MIDPARMLDRFVRLCETPSPVGSERALADLVVAELSELGVAVEEDGAAAVTGAGAGNLLARIPGRTPGFVLLCAHIDTVPEDGPIEVVLDDGVYRSRGETILGADNKAAVTVLMELAALAAGEPPAVGLELLFTVAEEDGLRGAKAMDAGSLRAAFGFVFDHATPIGELIVAAPSLHRVTAEFSGVEAHAGLRPEGGRNAIRAAASAVSEMPQGRLEDGATANVGVIAGGTATNVVAGRCRVEAEARSLDPDRVAQLTGGMVEACNRAAGREGCDVDVELAELFRAYRLPRTAASVATASAALERRGHEVKLVDTRGGSDANALVEAGIECLNVANGTAGNHTAGECVPADAIVEMLAVAEAIVEEAAARC